jgi:zinc protease
MAYALDALDEATLARARAEVLNERLQRVTQRPLGEVAEYMHEELFPAWHPYHHLPIGTVASIQSISVADARAFARTWYGPANATLVIAGNVDPTAAPALVQRYFGGIPARTPPARPTVPEPSASAATLLHIGANVTRHEIRFSWVTPAFGEPDDIALDLAAAVLVDRGAGWLESILYRAPRLASNVVARQRSMNLASVFEIEVTVSDGRPVKDVLEGIREALAHFESRAGDDEIQQARRAFENRKLFELESSGGLAASLASWSRFGALPAQFDGGVGRYRGVSRTAVRSAVDHYLGVKPWVIAIARPEPRLRLAGAITDRQTVAW